MANIPNYTDYGLYVDNSRVVVSDTLLGGNGDTASDYALYATGVSTTLTVTHSTFQGNSGAPNYDFPS